MFEFQASLGEIEVTAHANEYERLEGVFEIHAGLNELTMEAERSIGVVVVLKDGSTIVPWDITWNALAEPVEEQEGMRSAVLRGATLSTASSLARFTVPSPGRYRIAIPDIDGYLPVRPLEVQIAPGPHRRSRFR